VVCELVDVVLIPGEGAEPDPITFQPMSLTIRGSERLVVVAEDRDIRRQIFDCLGGLSVPASGGVHLFGHDSGKLSSQERRDLRRGQIGLFHPDVPLLSALTIEENLRLALELCADPHPPERLQELVERFDLDGCRHRYPSECGVESRIRAGLARALASRPLCLVADMVEGTDETERTLTLTALAAGLENSRTTAIMMLPMEEIPDWVHRAVQVSATGMAELARTDLVVDSVETAPESVASTAPEGTDDENADDAVDPAPELEEAA